jgi:hypothetical protein
MAIFAVAVAVLVLTVVPAAAAWPSGEVLVDGPSSTWIRTNASVSAFAFACPVGTYLSAHARREREARLTAAWQARLNKRRRLGQRRGDNTELVRRAAQQNSHLH